MGLLFLIPGLDETLRVNGTVEVATDEATLEAASFDGLRPKVALRVTDVAPRRPSDAVTCR